MITFFAPVNVGCLNADLAKTAIDQVASTNIQILRDVLKGHVMSGLVKAESLTCGSSYNTLLGGTFKTTTQCIAVSHSKAQVGAFNTQANLPVVLKPTDIEFCNGYVQSVSNVIKVADF